MVVRLHQVSGQSQVNGLANQVVGHGVLVPAIADQIIIAHLGMGPDGRLIRRSGKRTHELTFLFLKSGEAAACPLLEGTAIQLLQLLNDSTASFIQRKELPVAQRCRDPGGDVFHGTLRGGLVVRPAYPRRDNRRAIVLRQLLVAAVQYHLIAVVGNGSGLGVVWNQQTRHAAEVIKGVDVAQKPVLLLHVAAGLRIGVPAARQYRHKNVSRPLFPGNAVGDVQRITGPVHLHGVPGLVCDAHGGLRNPRPAAVLLAVLGVRIRNAALAANLDAVLFPQKRQRHAVFRQFPVDIREIRHSIHRIVHVFPGEQNSLQLRIRNIVLQRPGNSCIVRRLKRIFHSMM